MKKSFYPFAKNYGKIAILLVAVVLIFSGMAGYLQTGQNTVRIHDISYYTSENGIQHALLYIPKTATAETPAPGVVTAHGMNNTAEMQDINAIELARRGYVVLSIDLYRHGLSSETTPPLARGQGEGTYAALQYLGGLSCVDVNRVGMVGHSMGGRVIQHGALRAWKAHETDPSIVVPRTIVPVGSRLEADTGPHPLTNYAVNIAQFNAQFDEFDAGLEGKLEYNKLAASDGTFGFPEPEYDNYYRYGVNKPLEGQEVQVAAQEGMLRNIRLYPITHPALHFSTQVVEDTIDFMDITLRDGQPSIPSQNQTWPMKHLFTGIAMLAAILLVIPLGGALLQTPFFQTIVRPEPQSYSLVDSSTGVWQYVVLVLLCAVPPALLYYYCMAWGNALLSNLLPLNCVNGIVVLNLLSALVSLVFFVLLFVTIYRKNGASLDNMGIKLPLLQVLKSILLALTLFAAFYGLLLTVNFFFHVDYRFWVFSFRIMSPARWGFWLRYMPFYLVFFLVSGLSLNMTTRIQGKSELVNTVLCFVLSVLGLLALFLVDYGVFFVTNHKLLPMVGGANTGLSGILLMGILFILPLAALISRFFFKKTGSIWAGAFVNTCIVTMFAVSNTMVNAGSLL